MKKLHFLIKASDINEKEFNNWKIQENLKLPESYISFMLENNPVSAKESFFVKGEFVAIINNFFPFTDTDIYGLSLKKSWLSSKRYLPNGYFPFAYFPSGDDFVISMNDSDYGKVYLHLSEHDMLKPLADSFEEFINGLKREAIR